MSNKPFTSNYGFDLGELTNIELSGTSSTTDQVLVLKYDGTGKYYLYPQDLSATANSSIQFSTTGSSFLKKEVFTYSMNPTSSFTNIASFNFNLNTKTKMYLTAKIDLIGQAVETEVYGYYHFTTGYNIISDVNGDASEYYYRHVPSHFSYLFNKNTDDSTCVAIGPDKQFQNFSSLPTNNTLLLQPKFSTITDPLDISDYPKIISSINTGNTNTVTDDSLTLTIQAKSIKSVTEKIEWFGSVEFFASIV